MSQAAQRRYPWVRAAARSYIRGRFTREFDGLYVQGLAEARALVEREPLVIAATHVSWWDPLVAVLLDGELGGAGGYCLMDADNLARHAYFGLVGAVPLNRTRPKQALLDMRAAARLLTGPSERMWIFPQGRQRPSHLRPLALQAGVSWLSRSAGARVLPLALTYTFREAPRPSILASFGAPVAAGGEALMPTLEAELTSALARIDAFVEGREGGFEALTPPLTSDPRVPWLGRVLNRLLRAQPSPLLGAGKTAR
jgi:1-acyl-sn-glycerol-3-phosphate acyltransferase